MRALTVCLLVGAALIEAFSVGRAAAAPRSAVARLTCAEAMDLVRAGGDVVIAAGGPAPERLVRDRSYCEVTEIAELRFAPTRDNPQCPLGYRCREPAFDDWNW